MDEASETSYQWYMDVCPPCQQDDLEKEPIIIASKIIAAGLDELAMSNRMIAEVLNRKSEE